MDWVIAKSGKRRNIEVGFFGGEPLMAMDTVKATVEYARSLEEKYDKQFRFTITTNGVLLNMKFSPSAIAGDEGESKLIDLMSTYFFDMGGGEMQLNIVSADTLREAMEELDAA